MADYIYLLENRLSPAQQRALSTVRSAVRAHDLTLFLTGGAVRDLTGGGSVRDLDVTVQGETTALRGDLEAAGGVFVGDFAASQSLYFVFPGGVRMEVSAAMSVTYPKPGKPEYELTSISEDLRRRDFTANAMALSLNEGSYGLLMDPLNGVADIENRELRLVSNYGFIEDPARLVRAVRLSARLGWHMEARTQQRYDNAKEETTFDVLSQFARGYEIEELFHEEDPQRVMRALEAEGWLAKLLPQAVLGKSNETALADLREKQGQLQTQGILADNAAIAFPLLIAKLAAGDAAALKSSFARQGFVREIETLEERTRELQTRLNSKDAALPSAAWRMLYEAEPGLVLSVFYTGKGGAVQARLKTFLTESPTARQRLPYQLMQEMRILPDNPVYHEVLDKVFFELMDGKLQTPDDMKAFLEPYSPPAPPPPLNLRRARVKKEARPSRAKAKKAPASVLADEEAIGVSEGLMEPGTLTGPDRGTEPTVEEPLEGKVAPLAPGEVEPPAGKPAPRRPAPKAVPVPAVGAAEPGSAEAKKLTVKPAPLPPRDAEALLPHPMATKEIAQVDTDTLAENRTSAAKKTAGSKTPSAGKKEALASSPSPTAVKVVPPARQATDTRVATASRSAEKKAVPAKSAVVVKPVTPAKKAASTPDRSSKPAAAAAKPTPSIKVVPPASKTVAKSAKAEPAKAVPAKKSVAPAAKSAPAKSSGASKGKKAETSVAVKTAKASGRR